MSHWPCFEEQQNNTEKSSCSHEIVFVWNAINKNATENNNYQSEEEQRAYFLQILVELRDRMDSGCVYVGLIKYGSCAYIRHELSNDYESVKDQILYEEGFDPLVDSVGLGDGYSNLLAAYYQIYEVLNNPATSKPPGPVYPYQRTKHVVMSVYDVWGLDWAANHPNSQSMPPNGVTDNPGFIATQPDDHQILYESTTYPLPAYYMNPMSWAVTAFNPPVLSGSQSSPSSPQIPWSTLTSNLWNSVDWAIDYDFTLLNCIPDMGQAQTWFMNNIHPTLHGQVENYPGPSGSPSTTCNNCYQYDYIHPDSIKPDPTYTGVIPFLPTQYNGGDMWYFVMDNQMEAIQIQYDALYGPTYNANDDPINPGANWPPLLPASRNYFEDTYLKANQCGNDTGSSVITGRWIQGSRRGDGIYLPTDDFGGGATGEYFLKVVTGFAYDLSSVSGPPTVRGSYPDWKGILTQGMNECLSALLGEWVCPPGYDLILREGEHICCLIETTEPIIEDQYLPISLDDEFYFKEISWTVSYDPKSQAWISFHDWHPELCFPSINHFLTTKTFKHDDVECPPGYTWNSSLELCEQAGIIDEPAIINVDEVAPVMTQPPNHPCQPGTFYFDETYDPDNLISGWTRFCFNADRTKTVWRNIELNPSNPPDWQAAVEPTGLRLDGVIDAVSASYAFFPCPTAFDCRYLGIYGYATGNGNLLIEWNLPLPSPTNVVMTGPMVEGQNVGPRNPVSQGIPTNEIPNALGGKTSYFYYNSDIQNYVVVEDIGQDGTATPSAWVTYNPLDDTGQTTGDPTASWRLTTTDNWSLKDLNTLTDLTLSGAAAASQYTQCTINDSNIVEVAANKLTVPKMIRCLRNSQRPNGFYSICSFKDYTHEVTIGSEYPDDDYIGIVIGAYKDINGDYGLANFTYTLTLLFNLEFGTVAVHYNWGSSTFAFSNSYKSNAVTIPPTSTSSLVLQTSSNPFFPGTAFAPFNHYRSKGNVRVKIEKVSSIVKIWTTESMGTGIGVNQDSSKLVGESNPYTLMFDFDLADSATWTDANTALVVGDELLKFIDDSKIGYITKSQPFTEFFDMKFEGIVVGTGTCDCPAGYIKVYKNSTTGWFTETSGFCAEDEVICRKIECICPPAPVTPSTLTESGKCDDIYETIADGASGSLNYINTDPRMCHFAYVDQIPGKLQTGSIWKHNQRCDSFANYYGTDYPWEVELVESTGQAVNTVRNLEYQLESYVYKGNKLNQFECGDDRWHDLDWNFDEVIIYNTEQVSGLLKLNLNPKSDPITALQYPIINAADIDILYTKEEQKYRLNQFWDITKDRGEFTSVEQQIFITQLNGYIRDLNAANLDYNKAPTQRKKFRHYYNKAILRRRISGNRKMLLKLVNTKLNLSFR